MRYEFTVVCDDDDVSPEVLALTIDEQLQAGGRDDIRVYHSAEAADQGERELALLQVETAQQVGLIMADRWRLDVNESKRIP